MAKLVHRPPSGPFRQHYGEAVVALDGRDSYLGPWRSEAGKVEYDWLVGE